MKCAAAWFICVSFGHCSTNWFYGVVVALWILIPTTWVRSPVGPFFLYSQANLTSLEGKVKIFFCNMTFFRFSSFFFSFLFLQPWPSAIDFEGFVKRNC
ncbi:hypothetical protein L228DRAFT_24874 [Xylona heveae TC161]|uniref:Uncharacterized protein n=1 Tax=Xylona heveae (strain CBS 132557 / TC161) TaxID=1328760 RepID=A0A165AC63_XYLHT|nr:hypothetical protein L228DRAFT_24874 [Xylona heveae TC161]KZF20239.1 hypothetical protein L228DRAFT_24874 [Xylona heveae TC161]